VQAPTWGSSTLLFPGRSATALTVSWSHNPATDNAGVAKYVVYRQIDGTWEQVGETATGATTFLRVTDLEPTTSYTFKVEAVDAAGHESTTGPVGTGTTRSRIALNATLTTNQGRAPLSTEVRISASSDDGVPVTIEVDFGTDTVEPIAPIVVSSPYQRVDVPVTFPAKGGYTITVTATDEFENEEVRTLTATALNNPPTGTLTISPSVQLVDAPVTVSVNDIVDPDGDELTYRVLWRDSANTVSQGAVEGDSFQVSHPYTKIGTHPVRVELGTTRRSRCSTDRCASAPMSRSSRTPATTSSSCARRRSPSTDLPPAPRSTTGPGTQARPGRSSR
jgi:hypothetical protein